MLWSSISAVSLTTGTTSLWSSTTTDGTSSTMKMYVSHNRRSFVFFAGSSLKRLVFADDFRTDTPSFFLLSYRKETLTFRLLFQTHRVHEDALARYFGCLEETHRLTEIGSVPVLFFFSGCLQRFSLTSRCCTGICSFTTDATSPQQIAVPALRWLPTPLNSVSRETRRYKSREINLVDERRGAPLWGCVQLQKRRKNDVAVTLHKFAFCRTLFSIDVD